MDFFHLGTDILDRTPLQISYGQQKRVAIVRTLLKYFAARETHPGSFHLFLFDEIFSGIHRRLRRDILDYFLGEFHGDPHVSILWIAHGDDELEKERQEVEGILRQLDKKADSYFD